MQILILSCDNNQDLGEPGYILTEKYWPDHPEIIYLTDTIDNPYYRTIKKNYPLSSGSRRVRDAAEELEDDLIFIIPDDLFIYEKVNTNKLIEMSKIIDSNTGSLNLHHQFSPNETIINSDIQLRPKHAEYNCSVQCSIWGRNNLLRVFDVDLDPGKFETTVDDLGLNYYVYNHPYDFLTYRDQDYFMFGLWRGKGSNHCYNLFNREGIKIDFTRRGFCGK